MLSEMCPLLLLAFFVLPSNAGILGQHYDGFSNTAITQVLSKSEDHYLVFDQVGHVASATTYMHVMLRLNFSAVEHQIQAINKTLSKLMHTKMFKSKGYWDQLTLTDHLQYNVNCLMRRLKKAEGKINTLLKILPPMKTVVPVYPKADEKQNRYTRASATAFPGPPTPSPDSFTHIEHPILSRHKRWVMGLLAGGVVGTLFGLYNHFEIQAIAEKVQNVEATQNLLIHLTHQHSAQIEKLTKATEELYDSMTAYQAVNPQIIYIEFNELVNQVEEGVQRLINAVQQLQHRRLAVDWLTEEQLEALHQTVMTFTKEKKYKMLTTNPSDYFQVSISSLTEKN